jgi:hypothetical protein
MATIRAVLQSRLRGTLRNGHKRCFRRGLWHQFRCLLQWSLEAPQQQSSYQLRPLLRHRRRRRRRLHSRHPGAAIGISGRRRLQFHRQSRNVGTGFGQQGVRAQCHRGHRQRSRPVCPWTGLPRSGRREVRAQCHRRPNTEIPHEMRAGAQTLSETANASPSASHQTRRPGDRTQISR